MNNDLETMLKGMQQISVGWLLFCVVISILFVSLESLVLALLLKREEEKLPFMKCVKYALIGYFYSGITPSASGGQPMQLLAMTKDGFLSSRSTATLLVMAFYYKLVMVLIGGFLGLFWIDAIKEFFGIYLWVYYMGMILNILLLTAIIALMFIPSQMEKFVNSCCNFLVKIKVLKANENRKLKIKGFISQYTDAVNYMFNAKRKIFWLILITLIQRLLPMFIPVIICLGLPLPHDQLFTIFLIQMATYVAVDMFPLPGAQGISEMILLQSLTPFFTTTYVGIATVLTRGISFYLILFTGLGVVIWDQYNKRKIK